MAVKIFTEAILLLKVDCLKGFLDQCKIERIANDNQAAVTQKDL